MGPSGTAVASFLHMLWTYIGSIFRHGLTSAGGALVARGLASQQDGDTAIGAIMFLIGFFHSVYVKWKASQTLPKPVVAAPTSPTQKIPISFLFLILASASFTLTGCGSTPQKIAYQAAGTTVVTVDTAMSGWGAYVAVKHPGTNEEMTVKNAYEKYQASMAVVCDAGAAYSATGGTNATATAAFNQAIANSSQNLTDLEKLITTYGVTLK